MYFQIKNTLKNNRYNTFKYVISNYIAFQTNIWLNSEFLIVLMC